MIDVFLQLLSGVFNMLLGWDWIGLGMIGLRGIDCNIEFPDVGLYQIE